MMKMYNNYGYNPYFNNRYGMQQPMNQPMAQMEQQQPQFQSQIKQGLLGEIVESLDVVKALSYPLNGSTSYFPTTDGTKIYTKQLQMDGNVKISTYVLEKTKEDIEEQPKYATIEDIEKMLSRYDYKDDIDEIKKALKKAKKEEL